MLDELSKAAAAIEAAGITAKNWHPKFKPLPKVSQKNLCIRILLDANGHIADLEILTATHAAKLRKFEPDNGKSFPGFNIRPLFIRPLSEADAKRSTKEITARLRAQTVAWDEILEGAADLWAKDTVKTVERVLVTISADLSNLVDKTGDVAEEETLSLLFAAVNKMDAERFQTEYCEKLKAKISNGSLPLSTLLFFGKEGKESKISVFFDVKDYKDYPVAHEKTIARINDLLLAGSAAASKAKATETSCSQKDAYGADAVGSKDPKMAQVPIPVLGGVLLRSQAKAIPAQSRYNLCEGATFPVGNKSREKIKRTLEWLSNIENKGKTYGIAGDKELLFAYPAQLRPDSLPELALLLGAQSDDERKFSDLAESVVGQLKGTGEVSAKDGGLEIFSLRKMDQARTKVVYYHNTTVASLEAASHAWDAGFKNIPHIRVHGEAKNDRGKRVTVTVDPQTLFPLRLHKILNTVWRLENSEPKADKIKIFEPSTGLNILLDTPEVAQIAYITERFLSHAQTYFSAMCRATGRDETATLPDLETYPGILGLLLYKLGKKKENYMNESAFLLGRFLRVADEIHRLYCEIVRVKDGKPDIPPELCGSSLLTATLENPTQALAQLCVRSAPYLKWARAYHGEKKGGLVHYWMHQWAPIADRLHETNWPPRPSPEDRAQIFLGYLSSFLKSENTPTSTETKGTQQ